MKQSKLQKLTLSAVFLALGIVLPLLTAQIKEIGDTLLPMHFPVMLCGLLCGPQYGALIGLLLPFLRSVIFSMPPLYPNAVWMALELAAYGLVIGFVYLHGRHKHIGWVYVSLITAMLVGRAVWGIAKAVLLGIGGKVFTISAFVAGGFLDAIPGMALQLIFIPLIVKIVTKPSGNEFLTAD